MNRVLNTFAFDKTTAALLISLTAAFLVSANPSYAGVSSDSAALGAALASNPDAVLFARQEAGRGFTVSSSFFSGRASGTDVKSNHGVNALGVLGENGKEDRFAELEGDQRMMALMIDGSYDFNYDFGTGLPMHPYVNGGIGMAMYEQPGSAGRGTYLRDGDMVPLFRVGGGVVYRLGSDWDLSLNYKAGFSAGDSTTFTGRDQRDQVDLQVLDMGMKFRF